MWRPFLTFTGAGVGKDQRHLVFHMKGFFMRHFVFLLVFFLSLGGSFHLAFAAGLHPHASLAASARVGELAPDLTLENLQEESVTLSHFRGKVVLLNFWGAFCGPCRAEMPSMERLHEVFADKDFVILAVHVGQGSRQDVKAFLEKKPYSFSILFDPDAKAQGYYGVYRIPETFLIDKSGKIVERHIGSRDWSSVEMLNRIFSLVSE
jgi:peroxiredoxin